LTFNGLHGVISQKIEFFITTAVRTSNPRSSKGFENGKIFKYLEKIVTIQIILLFSGLGPYVRGFGKNIICNFRVLKF
jgi:hypothetical protein